MLTAGLSAMELYDAEAVARLNELGRLARTRIQEAIAVAGVVASAIGAFYYLRIVYLMYFGEEGDGLDAGTHAAMLAPGSDLTGAGWGDDDEAKQHLFWGLGWGLQEGRHGPSFWHWGDQGTARCFVLAYPEDGDALVYFTNSANGLAIGPAILDLAFDDDHWSMRWLDYARYDDPVRLAEPRGEVGQRAGGRIDRHHRARRVIAGVQGPVGREGEAGQRRDRVTGTEGALLAGRSDRDGNPVVGAVLLEIGRAHV